MTIYPVKLTHRDTGAFYEAPTRLELQDALRNGWVLAEEVKMQLVAKQALRKKASSQQVTTSDPEEGAD